MKDKRGEGELLFDIGLYHYILAFLVKKGSAYDQ